MRIVYLHQYFRTPAQSGGVRSYHFARALTARGHDVHVISSRSHQRVNEIRPAGDGVSVHWIDTQYDHAMSNTRRLIAFCSFALRACRIARGLGGDVIVASSTPLTIVIPALWAKIARRTPLVFEVRDLWPEVPVAMGELRNPLLRVSASALERLAYCAAAEIVTLSPGMTSGVRRRAPRDRPISTITNVADIESFTPTRTGRTAFLASRPELGRRPIVMYCGTIGRVNNVGFLVDIASASLERDRDVDYVLIGEGREKAAVAARARLAGVLGRNLHIYDEIPKDSLPGALAAADVVLSLIADIPALENNSANKFFDALAAGRPIAINHGGWQADLLSSEGAGLRLSREPAEAEAALGRLAADEGALAAMGMRARELADRFSLTSRAAEFCDVVERAGRNGS